MAVFSRDKFIVKLPPKANLWHMHAANLAAYLHTCRMTNQYSNLEDTAGIFEASVDDFKIAVGDSIASDSDATVEVHSLHEYKSCNIMLLLYKCKKSKCFAVLTMSDDVKNINNGDVVKEIRNTINEFLKTHPGYLLLGYLSDMQDDIMPYVDDLRCFSRRYYHTQGGDIREDIDDLMTALHGYFTELAEEDPNQILNASRIIGFEKSQITVDSLQFIKSKSHNAVCAKMVLRASGMKMLTHMAFPCNLGLQDATEEEMNRWADTLGELCR